MPTTRIGRVAACSYFLAVLGAVVTSMIAPDNIVEAGFNSVLILTFPLGFLGYGLLSGFAMSLGSNGGVVPAILLSVVCVVVFMGAAVVNLVTVRGLWRWWSAKRRPKGLVEGERRQPGQI